MAFLQIKALLIRKNCKIRRWFEIGCHARRCLGKKNEGLGLRKNADLGGLILKKFVFLRSDNFVTNNS